jgi:hypothetical protein
MQKLLSIALFVGLPLVGLGCTEKTIIRQVPPAETPAAETGEEPTGEEETPAPGSTKPGGEDPKNPTPSTTPGPEDTCLDGQDLDAADINVSTCPAPPAIPADVKVGKETFSLGAWEIGTTSKGDTYKYGTLSSPATNPRVLNYEGGTAEVNAVNLECWSKGYYRLRKILQDPPAEYMKLRQAGFQVRFFQFQTDLRNGPTGYSKISSFQDHLVKWVTVINAQGVCQQPTLTKFKDYAKAELTKRGIN